MRIEYVDTSRPDVRSAHADVIQAIQDEQLIYPVTLVDGRLCCDGAVSYPSVMRSVEALIVERSRA